jgi:hypothetical protein
MKIVKLVMVAPAVALGACTSNGGTLSFSVTSRQAGAPAASAPFAAAAVAPAVTASGDSTVIALGSDTVIVRSVELVLRQIELKRSDVPACDAVEGNGDCEEFETGPTLVALPLGSTAIAQQVAINAPAGTYDALEFEIHKPSSGGDAAFVAAHPDFANISIRVTGTYSQAGTRSDFVFTSDVDQSEEMNLVPPLVVQDGQAANVTLRVDIGGWFLNAAKSALVDPASANPGQPNQSVVANNIQNSFKAFEDDNRDGLED